MLRVLTCALSMGAHPLRGPGVRQAGPSRSGLIQPRSSTTTTERSLVPRRPSWPSLHGRKARANQASIIRFTDAFFLPACCASFVARCSSWIPDSGTQDRSCLLSMLSYSGRSLSLSLSLSSSPSMCVFIYSPRLAGRENDGDEYLGPSPRSSC